PRGAAAICCVRRRSLIADQLRQGGQFCFRPAPAKPAAVGNRGEGAMFSAGSSTQSFPLQSPTNTHTPEIRANAIALIRRPRYRRKHGRYPELSHFGDDRGRKISNSLTEVVKGGRGRGRTPQRTQAAVK